MSLPSRFLNGRVPKLFKFGLVGASGIFVNTAALALFGEIGGFHYLLGAVLATQISSAWNFLWTETWVFRTQPSEHRLSWRFLMFLATNNAALLLRGPMIYALTEYLGVHYLISNFISLVALFAVRFAISDQLIWNSEVVVAGADGVIGGDD